MLICIPFDFCTVSVLICEGNEASKLWEECARELPKTILERLSKDVPQEPQKLEMPTLFEKCTEEDSLDWLQTS